MKIEFSADDLRPLVRVIAEEVLTELESTQAELNGRLAYTEAEAASLLGVQPHVLRDCRLRGEIAGVRCGKRINYPRDELLAFLQRNRTQ